MWKEIKNKKCKKTRIKIEVHKKERVKRNPWNFVWKKEDHFLSLNTIWLTDSVKYREGKIEKNPQ